MEEEINLAEDRRKKLKKILKTEPEERSDDDIRMIEALVEVSIICYYYILHAYVSFDRIINS